MSDDQKKARWAYIYQASGDEFQQALAVLGMDDEDFRVYRNAHPLSSAIQPSIWNLDNAYLPEKDA